MKIKALVNNMVLVRHDDGPKEDHRTASGLIIPVDEKVDKGYEEYIVVCPSKENTLDLKEGDIVAANVPVKHARPFKNGTYLIHEKEIMVIEEQEE